MDLIFETMKEMLGRREQIKLSGFGKFEHGIKTSVKVRTREKERR